MNNTERLLEDALRSHTASVTSDPGSRSAIAAQLDDDSRRRTWPALAAAASVVGIVAVSSVLLSQGAGSQSLGVASTPPPVQPSYAAAPTGPVSATPLDPATDFAATRSGHVVFVRATTGKVVGTLPPYKGEPLNEPVLSRDGKRAYGSWGESRVGFVTLATGASTVLAHRPGLSDSVTLSADGSTLAYEWIPQANGDLSNSAVVIRDMASGRERVLTGVADGPQELPLALSPNGATLAVTTTGAFPRAMLLVPTATGFAHARTVADAGCSDGPGIPDEPRWTTSGLYSVQHCATTSDGRSSVTSADIATINPTTAKATLLKRLPFSEAAQTFFMTVLDAPGGPLFVTADEGLPAAVRVYVRDPADGWSARQLPGLSTIDASGAE